ncbi:MAG TPA: glycosyltransferase [Thermodesulfobacteriota bacterium]|nr:glycosyltransferase [Thermodesulfobacteriota bacterium]
MKILFLIQSLEIGGVGRQLSILTNHLALRGHDMSVIALYATDQNWKLIWKLDSIDIRSLLLNKPTGVLAAGIELIKATLELRSLLKRENIQILYGYLGHTARFIAWLATRGMPNTKLIWGTRTSGDNTDLYPRNWKVSFLFNLCKWGSASVPLMISNSEAGYAYRKAKGYGCQKHLVITNGFDVEKFKPDPQARVRMRSELGALENEKLIGRVGRLDPMKGYPDFLEAAALLAKERKDVRFVIAGDGPDTYRRQLQLLSQELGLTERLIWAGVREDMPAVYNALDIACSSSSYGEGFPNTIGEAMACGIPCVVTDVGDSAKIVGDEGIIVPSGDPKKLANGLKTMLLQLDDIKPHLLRERIMNRFSIETMVESTEKALIEVCNTSK